MKNNLLHKPSALRVSFILLLLAAGMAKAFAYYDFSQTCATGQTLYYTITDATNHYVEISCPGDPNGSGCWTGFTQPTGDITLPSSVTYGGITYTVTSIGNSAFYHCDGMTGSLTIPNTVTLIDDYAFSSCSGFTGSLTIQNSVTAIGLWAFSQCSGFTGSLTIPSTLTTIGNRAFYICSGFTSISSLAVIPPSLGSYVFNGVNTDIPVMVPCGAEDNYSAASGWSTFMHIQGLCSMALLKIDAEHNPDPDDPNSPYMRVQWGVEDFESGMPSLPIWLNDGVYPWEITETNPYEGTYCIKSGNAGVNSSVSAMQLILEMPADGQISFFIHNSSESNYDFGRFYIDDMQQDSWSGNIDWQERVYALDAGIHILKWDFSKDGSMSSGDDCLYVDRISVNVGSGTTDLYRAHSDGSGWEWVADVSGIEYIDTDWEGLEMGFYKYGVVAEGSTLDEAFWSNSIEHPYVDPLTYAINSDGVSVTVTGHRDGTAATGSITIPETKTIGGVTYTVTAIGNHAFAGCSGFTGDLTIPNSVTTIEDEAFRSCTGFTGSLTIGNSVTTIGDEAFRNCTGFTGDLTIPNSVTTIGGSAFAFCSGFTGGLAIGNSVTTIGSSAFYGCIGFTGSLTIGNSVTTIGGSAFYACSGLTGDLTIPNSVTLIDDYAFYQCSGFTGSLTIGNSVTTIGGSAFYACSGLTGDLTIPNSVTLIDDYAFYQCSGFTGSLTLGNSLTTIEAGAFAECSGFTGSLTLGNSVSEIGLDAFAYCSGFTAINSLAVTPPTLGDDVFYDVNYDIPVTVPCGSLGAYYDATGWDVFTNWIEPCSHEITATADPSAGGTVSGGGTYTGGQSCTLTATPAAGYSFVMWTKDGAVVSISATYTFTVTSAATYVAHFEPTDPLRYAINSDGVSVQVTGHVDGTAATGPITIPETKTIGGVTYTVTGIGDYAFKDCVGLTGDLIIPNSVISIGMYAFFGCYNFTSLILSNSLTTIGRCAFQYCSGFTGSLTIPNSVMTIGESAFSGCSGFTGSLTIPNTVTTIGEYTFYQCSGFTGDLTIPNSVTTIGGGAFQDCSGFTGDLIIPNAVTTIGGQVFSGCSGFTGDLIIPNSVTTIGNLAFWLCSGFTAINSLAVAPPSLGSSVFYVNPAIPVTVPCGSLGDYQAASGWNMFTNWIEACSYTITATADPVEGGTVSGGSTYTGGQSCTLTATPSTDYSFVHWTKDGSEVSTDASYTFTVTGNAAYVAHFEFVDPDPLTYAINSDGVSVTVTGHRDDTDATGPITIPETKTIDGVTYTVTAIGDYAFYHCSGLTGSLTIPNSVTEIGNYAFWLCTGFTGSLTLGNSLTTIGESAFDSCIGFTGSLTLGNSLTTIEMQAFQYCSGFTGSLTIPNSVTTIGMQAFDGCSGFTGSLTIPNSVTTIGAAAFRICSGFTGSLTIPNSVTTIGPYAFYECSGFTGSLTLGNSLTTIGYSAFEDCSGFTAISSLAVAPPTLGDGAFSGVNPAIPVTVPCGSLGAYQAASGWDEFTNWIEPCPHEITATATPSAGGTVTGAGTYNHGASCTLTATANTGYTFVNWTEGGVQVSTNATYTFEVTTDRTLVANFTASSYIVSASATPSAGGTITGAGGYNYGESCTLTATANTGYTFVNWTEGGTQVSTNAAYTFTVTGNRTLVAHFEQNSYTITASATPSAGGTVSGGGTYNHGASCTLTATANAGYTFVNWTKGGSSVSTNANYTFTVTETGAYVAHFEQNSYTITVTANPSAGGTVSGAGGYNYGESCTLTATANIGYTFVNWTESGAQISTNAAYTFEVTTDRILVANFTQDSYTITATANPAAGGTVSGGGTYNYGESCTLTATPNAGYLFVNWTKDGSSVSTSATYTFTVTEAGNYVANFIEPSGAQTSNFTSGWNWWNTYIGQESIDGLAQLEACLGSDGIQIKSQAQYVNYYEGMGWMGMLSNINNESSYKIKTSAACVVEMTGEATTSASHPITIGPGWNWIGYPVNSSMSVGTALSGITPANGDQLKALNGYANYYNGMGWMGTLSTIEPGMGLLYKSNGSGSFTLVYPEGAKGETLVENISSDNNHWVPDMHAYPDNMTVTAIVKLDDEELTSDSYELAAFANGECRGSVRLMYIEPLDRYIAFLTITGEEVETLSFSLYDMVTGEEVQGANEQINFSNNATLGDLMEPYAVHFRDATSIDEWAHNLYVYPNPVAKGQLFSLVSTKDEIGEMQIEIINALGVVVETLPATSAQTIAAPDVAGVYTLRITVEGKGTCYRKLVVR